MISLGVGKWGLKGTNYKWRPLPYNNQDSSLTPSHQGSGLDLVSEIMFNIIDDEACCSCNYPGKYLGSLVCVLAEL